MNHRQYNVELEVVAVPCPAERKAAHQAAMRILAEMVLKEIEAEDTALELEGDKIEVTTCK